MKALLDADWFYALPGPARVMLTDKLMSQLARDHVWGFLDKCIWEGDWHSLLGDHMMMAIEKYSTLAAEHASSQSRNRHYPPQYQFSVGQGASSPIPYVFVAPPYDISFAWQSMIKCADASISARFLGFCDAVSLADSGGCYTEVTKEVHRLHSSWVYLSPPDIMSGFNRFCLYFCACSVIQPTAKLVYGHIL